jgi:ankyrin repeat protein
LNVINDCKMIKRTVILFSLLSFFFVHYGQEPEADTSAYIQGDLNFNLIYACDMGYRNEVLRLIQMGADVNSSLGNGVTPLMYATQGGHFEIVKILVQNNAEIDKVPDNGMTALISAVLIDSIRIAEFLIRSGADINQSDYYKVTPLMQAIANGNFLMTDMLLYYNADVTGKDLNGTDALMLASFLGLTDIVSLLYDYGANVNSSDVKQRTPLHMAVQNGFIDVVELLIEYGAEIDRTDITGLTALGVAIENDDLEMTRFLVSKGAMAGKKFTCSQNALTIAAEHKNDSIIDFLRQCKVKRILWPTFNKYIMGIDLNWNTDDFLTGVHFGLSDRKYQLEVFAEYKFRPSAIPVLETESKNVYFQYMERRGAFAIGFDKKIRIIRTKNGSTYGLFLGFKESITFGSYRGSIQKPDTKWLAIPRAGLYWNYSYMNMKFYYEYMKLDLYQINNGRINLSFYFNINWRKNVYAPKNIDWL